MTEALKPYTRVVVTIHDNGHQVVGYRRGAFHPEGTYPTIGRAMAHALSLPVTDPSHPVNVLRGGLLG